jgi:hypothetical protein
LEFSSPRRAQDAVCNLIPSFLRVSRGVLIEVKSY